MEKLRGIKAVKAYLLNLWPKRCIDKTLPKSACTPAQQPAVWPQAPATACDPFQGFINKEVIEFTKDGPLHTTTATPVAPVTLAIAKSIRPFKFVRNESGDKEWAALASCQLRVMELPVSEGAGRTYLLLEMEGTFRHLFSGWLSVHTSVKCWEENGRKGGRWILEVGPLAERQKKEEFGMVSLNQLRLVMPSEGEAKRMFRIISQEKEMVIGGLVKPIAETAKANSRNLMEDSLLKLLLSGRPISGLDHFSENLGLGVKESGLRVFRIPQLLTTLDLNVGMLIPQRTSSLCARPRLPSVHVIRPSPVYKPRPAKERQDKAWKIPDIPKQDSLVVLIAMWRPSGQEISEKLGPGAGPFGFLLDSVS
ncbi:hypothetical protein HDU67_008180 [Dinochytrium kinnereticum]|nr:hypothetical protein HDU67_008180 [Dinochytrium kinnereticum]